MTTIGTVTTGTDLTGTAMYMQTDGMTDVARTAESLTMVL